MITIENQESTERKRRNLVCQKNLFVFTSVTGTGENIALSVNRVKPSAQEILEVYADKMTDETVILCDESNSYNILEDKCTVASTKNINKVNGFHSFSKARLESMKGVATTYLNRYNAFFSKIYAQDQDTVIEDIYHLMTKRTGSFNTIETTQSVNLLQL